MLPWIIVLALLGLVLLFTEFLIPGFGIFGILGAVSLLASLVLTYRLFGLAAFLILLVVVIILFFLLILAARKSGLYNRVILRDKQEAQDFDESILEGLLGKTGETCTTLRPFGVAEFEGQRVDVCSTGDFIEKGKRVKVTQIEGKSVTVEEC